MTANGDERLTQILRLESYDELNVEIFDKSQFVSVILVDGVAEISRVDMVLNKLRTFYTNFSIFSRSGCKLKLIGSASTKMRNIKNSKVYELHRHLEEYRIKAEQMNDSGPIVLIVGPTDVGKSTLTRNLLNYAAQSGKQPLFVDLDVGQSSVSIPGTLSVLPVDSTSDVANGYNEKKICVYFHGHKAPGFNMLLYFMLLDHLSETVSYRMKNSSNVCHSGAIIDTCGWVVGQGYEIILRAVHSFTVNKVFVLADEDLCSRLEKDLPQSIEITFIDKLKGVVVRNKNTRIQRRHQLIHEYFYGSELTLNPHKFKIKYSDVQIVKFVCPNKISNFMFEEPIKYLSVEKLSIGTDLLNQVLAVSYADSIDDYIFTTSVLGFICVKDVDIENQIITVLSPKPEPLPGKILIMGDINYN